MLINKGFQDSIEVKRQKSISFLNYKANLELFVYLTGKVLLRLADPINSSALAPKGLK